MSDAEMFSMKHPIDPLNVSLRQFFALLIDNDRASKDLRRNIANHLRSILNDHSIRARLIAHLSDQEERIEYDPKHNYAKWIPSYGHYVACVQVSKSESKYIDMNTNGKPTYTNKVAHSAMARRRAAKIARTYYGD
jgi:hypothetical protein